jgi:hypothetical protein
LAPKVALEPLALLVDVVAQVQLGNQETLVQLVTQGLQAQQAQLVPQAV